MNHEEYGLFILEEASGIAYIVDIEKYEMIYLTRAGMKAYGLEKKEDYIGEKCYKLLQGLDGPCPFCTNDRLKVGEHLRWDFHNKCLNKWFTLDDTLVILDGKKCRVETATDKTEVLRLSNQLSMEAVLVKCLNTLVTTENISDGVQSFLETIGAYYGANRAYVFEFDLEKQILNNTFEWCQTGVSAEINNLQNIPLEVVTDWIKKFESVGEFYITSLDEDSDPDSDEYRILAAQGIGSLMATPLIKQGQIVGFIGVDDPTQKTDDITLLRSASDIMMIEMEKHRMTLELERALKEAKDANNAKSFFLFNMSHDVRTPMNAITGFIRIAMENATQPKVIDALKKADLSSRHMLSILNDVLDMSRIESGKMEFHHQNIAPAEHIQNIEAMYRQSMEDKGIQFQVEYGHLPQAVFTDETRISQVIGNLLSNATKFTPKGGKVLFHTTCNGIDKDGRYSFEVHVRDTGIGMSEEFLKKVFDPFERERSATVSGTQGTGIGLSLAKRIAEAMDGELTVTSIQGEGAEFIFTFKAGHPEQIAQNAESPSKEKIIDFNGKRLLLVEDIDLNREIAVEILSCEGFAIDEAEDGSIAVDILEKSKPGYYDCVLMDIQMPIMDGYEASQKIRAFSNPALANVPIIAMTANAFEEDRKQAFEAGMNGHVAKPIDVPNLLNVLSNVLSQ
uniref:hybrid sensor histidine kinase/response regulator n=1 Tax=Agathobacter sp. TaxID=2021311 RepID=UPI0040574A46